MIELRVLAGALNETEQTAKRTDVVEEAKEGRPDRGALKFTERLYVWHLPPEIDPQTVEVRLGVTQLLSSKGAKEVGSIAVQMDTLRGSWSREANLSRARPC